MSIHDEYNSWEKQRSSIVQLHKYHEFVHKNLSSSQQLQLNIKFFETYSELLLNNDSRKYNELLDLIEQGAKGDLLLIEPYCLTDKFTLSFDQELLDQLYAIWRETFRSPDIFVHDEINYFTVVVTSWISGRFYEQGVSDNTVYQTLKLVLTTNGLIAKSQEYGGRVGVPALHYMLMFLSAGNLGSHYDSSLDMIEDESHQRQEQLMEYVYNLVEIMVLTGTNLEWFWVSYLGGAKATSNELSNSSKYIQRKAIRLCIAYNKVTDIKIIDSSYSGYLQDYLSSNVKPFLHSGRSDLIIDALNTIEYRFGWQEIDNILLNYEDACLKIFNGFFSSKQARKTISELLNSSPIFRQKIFKFPYFIFDLVRKKERKLISQLLNYNSTEMKNMRDKHGNSLLLFACKVRGKNLKIVQLFTSHGFDVYLKNFEGLNAIDIAFQAKNNEVVTYIKSRLGVQ